ncbi:3-methyl-2-oxobutanoate hydroxymethyltransferase [Leptospira santarosai]|uniref:3-methyl-2-oxobutanoate hydroxymethyltransferase n=1 Tax=Leptospira santarosai TaxID=28183 RepID=UPI00062D9214|nr:3-methyl-2-oxobutanoate hydroxymethyltransferase [Leptospira santarosai]OLY63619.1 3-methyl-2-oxobutanoate hydroxymethyltransferase [Leptospira santarosai serovar Grippotyphosa]ONF76696.1 3-methyl-2-oxobutanoate hydroxymethyltransferase [Leptospira santarosai serovar Bananal]ONF84562.1 3-methyl-2-oxobutanoate hydroxymethyltransferase [Leptospira santarosai serovar Grippotyphosa]
MKKTLQYLKEKKRNNEKISVLTSYDFLTTQILEEANIDMIILGDSVGTNALGYQNETEVTLDDMIHHTKAVCRAKKNVFLVVDLPYKTYKTPKEAVENAKKLIDIGADAVKFEGIQENILYELKKNELNVMCHIGLNPQHDQERMNRGKIAKGKLFSEATELLKGAKLLEKAGADLIILEKIPGKISKIITENINMPTIGIGAGKHCDGQVLIIYDLLGMNKRNFKHSPAYINIRKIIKDTINKYKFEIDEGLFPNETQTNIIKDSEYDLIRDWCSKNKFVL